MPTQPQNKNSGHNNQNQASGGGSQANPSTGKQFRDTDAKKNTGSSANPSSGKWNDSGSQSE